MRVVTMILLALFLNMSATLAYGADDGRWAEIIAAGVEGVEVPGYRLGTVGEVGKADEDRTINLLAQATENIEDSELTESGARREDRSDSAPRSVTRSDSGDVDYIDRLNERNLRAVHAALIEMGADRNGMPASASELIGKGGIDGLDRLLDLRSLAIRNLVISGQPIPDTIATFRLGGSWRDGAIATSDLPRNNEWLILNGTGEVTKSEVDPAWLGSYTVRPMSDAQQVAFMDSSSARLGAYLSSGKTDSGRLGVGVDGMIPGFGYMGGDYRFDTETLLPGDLIVSVGGIRVESLVDLEDAVPEISYDNYSSMSFPSPYEIEVIRDGRIVTVKNLGPLPGYDDESSFKAVRASALDVLNGGEPSDSEGVSRWIQTHLGVLRFHEVKDLLVEDPDRWVYRYEGLVMQNLMYAASRDEQAEFINEVFRQGLATDLEPYVALFAAEYRYRAGEPSTALGILKHLENVITSGNMGPDPGSPLDEGTVDWDSIDQYWDALNTAWTQQMVILLAEGRHQEMMDELDRIVEIAIDPVDVLFNSSNLAYEYGQFGIALATAERLVAHPDCPDYLRDGFGDVKQRLQEVIRLAEGR